MKVTVPLKMRSMEDIFLFPILHWAWPIVQWEDKVLDQIVFFFSKVAAAKAEFAELFAAAEVTSSSSNIYFQKIFTQINVKHKKSSRGVTSQHLVKLTETSLRFSARVKCPVTIWKCASDHFLLRLASTFSCHDNPAKTFVWLTLAGWFSSCKM